MYVNEVRGWSRILVLNCCLETGANMGKHKKLMEEI